MIDTVGSLGDVCRNIFRVAVAIVDAGYRMLACPSKIVVE